MSARSCPISPSRRCSRSARSCAHRSSMASTTRPTLAVRGVWRAGVTGTRELDLTIAAARTSWCRRSFGVAGMIKLQPYGQFGIAMVNANTGVINFNPTAQGQINPTAEDGVFRDIHLFSKLPGNRLAGWAARWLAGAAVIGLEMNYAFGTNPVQAGQAAGSTHAGRPIRRTTRMSSGVRRASRRAVLEAAPRSITEICRIFDNSNVRSRLCTNCIGAPTTLARSAASLAVAWACW